MGANYGYNQSYNLLWEVFLHGLFQNSIYNKGIFS